MLPLKVTAVGLRLKIVPVEASVSSPNRKAAEGTVFSIVCELGQRKPW